MNQRPLIAGRFRLDRQLGEGGIGVVWRALDIETGSHVALKLLKSPRGESLRRFELEARALARLRHSGCVELLEYGRTDDGQPYLVMELLQGETLRDRIANLLPIDDVVDLLRQALQVLAYAHAEGIAHRDLKPANLFLARSEDRERLVILDFGLAKLAGLDTVDITKSGEVFGTPIYMSPEQLRGSRDAGPASDIYTLGVIAFELLEGHPPFVGRAMVEVAMKHFREPAPPVIRADCPAHLRALVSQMLAKEPVERPTAEAALQWLSGEEVPLAEQRTTEYEAEHNARRSPGRSPLGIVIALIGLAAIAVGTALFAIGQPTESPPPPPIERPHLEVVKPSGPRTGSDATAIDLNELSNGRSDERCRSTLGAGVHARKTLVGMTRVDWVLHVPAGLERDEDVALLFVFPHDTVTARSMFLRTEFDALADENGIALVGLDQALRFEPDLVGVVSKIRDEVRRELCVDDRPTSPTFVVGHRTGANAALATSCAPWVDGVATVAHLPNRDDVSPCRPNDPVPGFVVLPRDTAHVPLAGGPRCDKGFGGIAISADVYEEVWRERNGLGDARAAREERRGGTCREWRGETPFVSCHIDGGANWPQTAGSDAWGKLCPDAEAGEFDATNAIWRFFEASAAR